MSNVPAIEVVEIEEGKGQICRDVLEALPEWFGIPKAIDSYVEGVEKQPMFVCKDAITNSIIGFLSLRFHTESAAEAYVLGVRRERHRQGYGKALFDAASAFAGTRGARFLTVKTLAAANPDPNYAITRRFYEKIGFRGLEILPDLWGSENPCLLMIKLL